MELKIRKLREGAKIPRRATEGAAGMDLYACIDESITLAPQQLVIVPTGIAIELPDNGCAAFLYARSGLGVKHGICLANGVGVIDSDSRGADRADGDCSRVHSRRRRGQRAERHTARCRRLWLDGKKITE